MPICTHLDTINVTQLPYSVDGCEDCLATGGLVAPPAHLPRRAATSAAATTRRTAMPRPTRRRRRTRSSARSSRARTGAGASSTRWRCASRPCRGRRGFPRRPCSARWRAAPARLEAGDLPAARDALLRTRVDGMAVGADVDAQALARGAQVVLGAAVAAADERAVIGGVDGGVHRQASLGRAARRRLIGENERTPVRVPIELKRLGRTQQAARSSRGDHGLVRRGPGRDRRQRRAAGHPGRSRRRPRRPAVGLERLPADARLADPRGRLARRSLRRAARVLDRRRRLRRRSPCCAPPRRASSCWSPAARCRERSGRCSRRARSRSSSRPSRRTSAARRSARGRRGRGSRR